VGDRWKTPSKTITDTDMIMFNRITGLVNRAFIDEEYRQKEALFNRRFASGIMVIPIVAALFTDLRLADDTMLAMLGMEVKLTKPLFAGDTIYVEVEVASKKETKNPDRGIIYWKYTPVNQNGETLGEITEILMMKRKPNEDIRHP
jgi:acyl dehydratase